MNLSNIFLIKKNPHSMAALAFVFLIPLQTKAEEVIYIIQEINETPAFSSYQKQGAKVLSTTPNKPNRNGDSLKQQQVEISILRKISRIAKEQDVPGNLLAAIAKVESAYNPKARSAKGARGLMQLMPATASQYGVNDTLDAEANIRAGARHFKFLLEKYKGNASLALAAYNAGEGSVARHSSRIPAYKETLLYVPLVLSNAAAIELPEEQP